MRVLLQVLFLNIKQFLQCFDWTIISFVRWLAKLFDEFTRVAIPQHITYHIESMHWRCRVLFLLFLSLRAAQSFTFQSYIGCSYFDVHHRCILWIHLICQVFHLNRCTIEHAVNQTVIFGQRKASIIFWYKLSEFLQFLVSFQLE